MTMPRGQYTRKKPEDADPAAVAPEVDESTDGGGEPPADATDTDDGGDSPDADATAVESVAKPEDSAPRDPAAVAPSSPDNVVYPVDDNPAACPAPLCPNCFPSGWPGSAEQAVGCEHGMWIRQWPPAAD